MPVSRCSVRPMRYFRPAASRHAVAQRLLARLTQPVDEFQVHDHHRPDRRGVLSRHVKSDETPAASRTDGAVLVAEEIEAVDLGTRYWIAERIVVHRTPGMACPSDASSPAKPGPFQRQRHNNQRLLDGFEIAAAGDHGIEQRDGALRVVEVVVGIEWLGHATPRSRCRTKISRIVGDNPLVLSAAKPSGMLAPDGLAGIPALRV